MKKCRSIVGPFFENIRVVQQISSGRIKRDVGCDRMVFATNTDLFLIKFNSFFYKWSLDQGQNTTPQRKENAHGPSLHIRFLSKGDF